MMRRSPVLFGALSVALGLAAMTARAASYTRSMEFIDATPGAENIRAVATDGSGILYLAGRDMGAPTKHWIARVNPNGSVPWVRHSGDGFPDAIAQGYVECYGAAFISGFLVIVGQTRTATGATQDMGFIANMDPSNGTVFGVTYFPGAAGYNSGFRAVASDPSDATLAWVAGWTDSAVESLNGLLVKYNVNVGTPAYIDNRQLDANSAKASDTFYSICVTPGAVLLGGAQFPTSTQPWWARYDKTMNFQAQAVHTPPAGESDGAYVGLALAAGRLYAAVVGGTAGSFDSLDIRELNPANGSMQLPFDVALVTNGPSLGINTQYTCGMAISPVNGRLIVANFDRVWDLTTNRVVFDTNTLPASWQVDAAAFAPDGRLATAGWHPTGNYGTAALWSPVTASGGGTSTTLVLDPGSFKIAPNVVAFATQGWAGFHVRGNAGAPFTVNILDTAGRRVGSVSGTCDGSGAGLIKFYGGVHAFDLSWAGRESLPPGGYYAVVDGAGISTKPKPFVIVIRRVK